MERATSSWITNWLHSFGEIRDTISEAVFLSTRVLVMSARPATIAFETVVELPRPRTIEMQESGEFNRYVGILRHAIEAHA